MSYQYDNAVDYYAGRVTCDVLSMIGGSSSIVSGLGTIIGSVLGGGAITVSSGGILVVGGAIVVEGVIGGTAQVTYGGIILSASAKNFGNDLNKLNESMTSHGKERSQQRGFSDQKINDITQNYSHKVYQPGGRSVYAKKNGNYYVVVITNKNGQVIATVGGNTKSLKNWSDVTKMLNNNGGYSSLPTS